MAFSEKELQITFKLGTGSFGESGFDTVTLAGLRARAKISNAGGSMFPSLDLTVYGMTLSRMNQLSTLGIVVTTGTRNDVLVMAGERGKTLSKVYEGNITNAWIDGDSAPNVAFRVLGKAVAFGAIKPIPVSSYPETIDVADHIESVATKMGLRFENTGVNVRLTRPYFPRTGREQILAAVKAAGIEWNCGENGTVAIWPKGGHRETPTVPIISPRTGQVGYPAFTQLGIKVRTLFNPAIVHGSLIKIEGSQFPQANTKWQIFKIDHDLACFEPNGPWFSDLDCSAPGYTRVA